VGSIHFKQSSVSWAEQALRKVTPTARHQESVLLYIFMYFFYKTVGSVYFNINLTLEIF
jgi:hypothetical protein